MYRIQPYTPHYFEEWNAFVAASKNGTFLFHIDFMGINYGLVTQKEELACSTYTQDIIELQISEECIINP